MIKLPSVKSAFCGCSLEEGSKIIAYIHMVGYGILLIVAIVYSWTNEVDPMTGTDLLSLNMTNLTKEEDEDPFYMEQALIHEGFFALSSSYFNEMVFLIQVIFGISLLLGLYQKNLDLIFSWIILQVTNVIFSQGLATIYFITFFDIGIEHVTLYLFCEEITLAILEFYFIVIVASHMKELTEVNETNEEVLSPIVINSSSVDLRYPEDTNNFVH